ncbi:MAG: hypothetical protein AB7P99_06205 [Vicinamibacterales bacterium]
MSPILVRPVREQLEHDRVIRLLQAKYKRKFEVAINPGHEQTVPVGTGPGAWYPDLVLQSQERGRKLLGVVEVETAESVNHLEAMSQWAALARLRAPFHLYVPVASVDTARRLAGDLQISVAELWAYNAIGDQVRFTLVQRSAAAEAKARAAAAAAKPAAGRGNGASRAARPAARSTTARRPATASARRKPAAKPRAASTSRPRSAAAKPASRAKKTASSRAQKRK